MQFCRLADKNRAGNFSLPHPDRTHSVWNQLQSARGEPEKDDSQGRKPGESRAIVATPSPTWKSKRGRRKQSNKETIAGRL